jgi:hypothetical protein
MNEVMQAAAPTSSPADMLGLLIAVSALFTIGFILSFAIPICDLKRSELRRRQRDNNADAPRRSS